MKKLLSVILTLCLLLTPAFAMAEGSVTQLELSQIDLTVGDEVFELGLDLFLTLLNGDNGVSLIVDIEDEEGNSLAAAGLTADESGLTGMVDGMSNAYHITTDELMTLVSSIEDELGMSLSEAFDQLGTMQSELASLFEDGFDEILDALEDSERVEREDETVYVLEEEYLLHRLDVTVSADQVSRILDAVATMLTDLQALYPDQIDVDADDLHSLDGSNMDIRLWANDAETVLRGEFDLNLTDGYDTVTLPIVLEMIEDDVDGLCCCLSLTQEYYSYYFLINYVFSESEDGTSETLFLSLTGVDDYDNVDQVVVVLSADTDASGETTLLCYIDTDDGYEQNELGVCYIYENSDEDGYFLHDAYMDLWYDSYMDGEEYASYEVDFLLTVTHEEADTDGTLDLEGVSVLNLSELTEEQAEEAEEELYTALQDLLLGLMNDTGIQQLITLFSSVEDY